jgi:ribose transport system substrate-binding protein
VVLKAIQDGYVDGTMLQNPYGQGFMGSYALDKLRHDCKVKVDAPFKTIALTNRFIDSGTVYADKDALDNYVGSMQAITKKIFADFEKTYLACS